MPNPSTNYLFSVLKPGSSSLLLTAGMVCSCALSANAQDAGVIQQKLQKEIDQRRALETPISPSFKQDKQPKSNQGEQPKLLVKKFNVTGLSLITQEQALTAIQSKLNQELTFDQVQEAGQSIADLYTTIGRIATPLIPEQDVVDGIVEIRIIEAKVGSVITQNANGASPLRLKPKVVKGYFENGNASGDFLNIDQLNRSKALINDLPGVNAQVALVKSSQEGRTDVQVNLQEVDLLTVRGDVSNSGSTSTGVVQTTLTLNLNDPLGMGDGVAMDLALSQGSTYATVKYWLPAGYDGWRIAPGLSSLDYQSLSSFSDINSKGSATVTGLYAAYALSRVVADLRTLNVSMESKKYQNWTNDALSSAYSIDKLNLGISGLLLDERNTLSYGITASLGNLLIQNAAQLATDQSSSGPQTEGVFSKLNLNLTYITDLDIKNTSARLSLNGQLASHNLNSSEQLYLGGSDSVRAYPMAQGGGSQGLIATAELTHTYEAGLQFGAFLDVGVIQQYKHHWSSVLQGSTKAGNTYALKATGATVKYVWDKFQLQGTLAYRLGDNPLHSSTGTQLNVDNAYRKVQAWIKGSYAFN